MKKLICLLFGIVGLWLFHLPAEAPPDPCLYIEEGVALHPFGITDHQLLAVVWLESRFEERAVNRITGARGILQITPKMIKEVNKILQRYEIRWLRYSWKDAWDPLKSIDIWYLVQTYRNPDYDLKKACQVWFGTGRQYDGMTWRDYHRIVSKYIENLEKQK